MTVCDADGDGGPVWHQDPVACWLVRAAARPASFWQPHTRKGTSVAVAAAAVIVDVATAGMDIGEGGARMGEITGAVAGV